jgi:hypothetical protein
MNNKSNPNDYTEALSNMITPNNQPPTTFKQKKPPPKKKSSKSSSKNTNTQTQKKNTQNTKNKTQTTQKKKSSKLSLTPKNPNELSKQEVSQVNQVNNTQPIKVKSKQQSQKDFKKAQLVSNDKHRISLFSGVLDTLNQEKQENGQPILSLQRFTTISNSIMKIINDMNYLIQDGDTITDLLVKKFDEITSQISSKSVNTQRKIITDIITILSSNQDTKIKDIKRYEYLRKKIQLSNQLSNQPNPKTENDQNK